MRSVIIPSSIALRRSSSPGGADQNQLLELVADRHHFVEADAALVAGGVALVAAGALHRRDLVGVFLGEAGQHQRFGRLRRRLLAVGADVPHQPLRADEVHRARDEKGLDAHVHQTVDGARRVVGVERGEHEMAGERRLHRDFRRLEVTDFADEDDVRILTQERAQRGGEVEADVLSDLDLVHAGEVELDRILGGHDVGLGRVDLRDRRVERVRLAAAGRPGDEHHAPRTLNRQLELDERLRLEAEARHVEHQLVLVEETKDDLFAEEGRQHRDAEVDLLRLAALVVADLDAAVLRQALLGDVELRHDLHARHDGVAILHRRRHDVVEDAVDAVPDAQLLLVRLDVNVAGALLNGGHEHDVHEPDDRRVFTLARERVRADLLQLFENLDIVRADAERRLQLLEAAAGHLERAASRLLRAGLAPLRAGRGPTAALAARVVLLDRVGDGDFRRDDRLDGVAGHELDVVHREDVGRVRHRDRERAAGTAQRDDLVLARGLGGNKLDDGEIDLELREVDGRNAVLLAEERGDLLVLDEPHLDEVVPELPPVGLLLRQRLLKLLRGDQFLLEKEFTYADGHETLDFIQYDKICQK